MGQLFSSSQKALRVLPKDDTDKSSEISVPSPSGGAVVGGHPILIKAKGHHLYLDNGQIMVDGCGGAAVACIGHGRKDVVKAITLQAKKCAYVSWAHFENEPTQNLSDWLIKSTGGRMSKVYIMCSGSDAVEGAMKLAREYFLWIGNPQRVNFISRDESYHGTTVGSLSLSGHVARRAPFEPVLLRNRHRVSACNPYRQRFWGESDADFVARKSAELAEKFIELGPETVAAVIMEPVVGAALGCVPAIPGYLRAVQQICHRYGALLILDEVMCGMGRTGTLHAWEQEGVVPDLQTIGKGLAGGYQPASALLVGENIAGVMDTEGKTFTHGHTYQNHPVVAAAALKVQRVIQEENLLHNVQAQGCYLESLLRQRLSYHPNVGDIRGRGLFWAVEFVRDKATKQPFDVDMQIAPRVQKHAQKPPCNVLIYQGQGCAGGGKGDHIMIMPAYNADAKIIEAIVEGVVSAIEAVFEEIS